MPSGKTKPGAGAAKARQVAKATGKRQPAETKLAELKLRLLEISDLPAAGALLGWDQSTYMPRGGASARARQGATLSKLAHEKSVDPSLGKLLDELAPYAAGLPYQSDEASLIRVARRDFEKVIKVPSAYVARASALGSASYDAWTRARPANDFATMRPFLEQAVDLSREYAGFFAPYQHVADPLIDAAEEGMTTASICSLFAELRSELLPIVRTISEQPIPSDDCLRGSFSEPAQLDFSLLVVKQFGTRCSQPCTSPVTRFTSRALPPRLMARRSDREHRQAYTRASRDFGKMWSAAVARSGNIVSRFCAIVFQITSGRSNSRPFIGRSTRCNAP
jgi:hypothetical protein